MQTVTDERWGLEHGKDETGKVDVNGASGVNSEAGVVEKAT